MSFCSITMPICPTTLICGPSNTNQLFKVSATLSPLTFVFMCTFPGFPDYKGSFKEGASFQSFDKFLFVGLLCIISISINIPIVMGSYGSLFTDINKGVELFIYILKTSLTCLNMGHVSRAGAPIFNHISTAAISCRMRRCCSHTLCWLDHEPPC